jgi:hypothetical protein
LLEQSLFFDLDPDLFLLQRALPFEVELQLHLGLPRGRGPLLPTLFSLPIERHVAGETPAAPPISMPVVLLPKRSLLAPTPAAAPAAVPTPGDPVPPLSQPASKRPATPASSAIRIPAGVMSPSLIMELPPRL